METKQNEKRLSFVLYQEEKSPQYFEVKKNFLKFIFFAFPITLILLIFFIVVGTLYLRKIKTLGQENPNMVNNQSKNVENDYLKQIQLLQSKLNKPSEGLASLGLFKQVKGQTDLSKKPAMMVEGISFDHMDGKPRLQFSLSNNEDSSKKISGHLFVILKNNNGLKIYPENSISENDFQISFNKGEKFSFNRLRPFVVTMNENMAAKKLNFKILVFSLTGDLLFDNNYSISKN